MNPGTLMVSPSDEEPGTVRAPIVCFEVVAIDDGVRSDSVETYTITFSLQYPTDSFREDLYTTTVYGTYFIVYKHDTVKPPTGDTHGKI